jgi:hypothetical protein
MSSKKKIFIIIFIICVFCTLSITTLNYYKSTFTSKNLQYTLNTTNSIKEPFDYFTCTMNLRDIDPKFAHNYMKYDGKSVKCGPCEGATLTMNISNCNTDANGNLATNCHPNALITSSQGNPIVFPYSISPNSLNNFFCIE